MARWGENKTLLFVTYYRQHECLWNTRSPLYKNNIARNNAYNILLKEMNDPSLTIKILKTKIKNLRTVYHAENKKVNSSKRSGAGAEDVYKPHLPWFAEMASFIGDTENYRETIGSELQSEAPFQDSQPANDDDSNSNQMSPPPTINSPPPPQAEEENPKPCSSREYSTRRKKGKKPDETVVEALKRLENISSAINSRPEEGEFHFFGQNVASQLRALPLYEALDVQNEIQKLLTSARRRQIMYPNLTYSSIPSSNIESIAAADTSLHNSPRDVQEFLQIDLTSEQWKHK